MQLLVSVRSSDEARLATRHGIQRLDVKEPTAGSLGAASTAVWQEVVRQAYPGTEVSVALGELSDTPALREIPPGIGAVKIGLSRCSAAADWREQLRAVYAAVPIQVDRVAVYYADTAAAGSPDFESVLSAAVELGCRILLIDTFDKSRGPLIDACTLPLAQRWREAVHAAGLQMALGGSLRQEHLVWVESIRPDIVAVRGGVCGTDRRGSLCPNRLTAWLAAWNRLPGAQRIEPRTSVST